MPTHNLFGAEWQPALEKLEQIRARLTASPDTTVSDRSAISRVFALWDTALTVLEVADLKAASILGDTRLTAAVRAEDAGEVLTESRQTVDEALADATSESEGLIASLRRRSLPERPEGDLTSQETVLAGLKSDLRMVLDPTPSHSIRSEMADLLAEYAASGNDLAVWLLTASDWPALFYRSRGETDQLWRLNDVPRILEPVDGDTRKKAARLLVEVDGAGGLTGSLIIFRQLAEVAFRDLADTAANAQPAGIR